MVKSATLLLTTLLLPFAIVNPTLHKRSLGGLSDVHFGISDMSHGLKEAQPTVGPCHPCKESGSCNWGSGVSATGQKWFASWRPGRDTFFDFDGAVSKYLTNLHFVQDDGCISVEGSECAAGYGGGILNARVLGKEGAEDSLTVQAAIDAFVGVDVFDLNDGVTFDDTRVEVEVIGHRGLMC